MSLDTRAAPPLLELKPILSEKYAVGRRAMVYVLVWALFGMYLSYVPVFHSDIWGHVHYGKWILEHRALPAEDPFTPLAEGVPVIATAWGGQVLFALAERLKGTEGVSFLYAVTVLATFLIHLRTLTLRSGRADVATLACGLVFLGLFSRHAIARPEVFGGLCFALTIWLVTRVDAGLSSAKKGDADWVSHPEPAVPWSLYVGLPLVHLAWANLHGSFIVGIAFLGCRFLGRVVEVLWSTHDPAALIHDRWCRRWLLLTELSLTATLVNPYGFDLLLNVFQFSNNPNLRDVLEWYPMDGKSWEGIHFAITMVVLMVLWRHSSRPVLPADVILLVLFAIAAFPTVRMIGWYAVILGYVAAPHLGELLPKWFGPVFDATSAENRSYRYTILCVAICWMGFNFSPLSGPVLGGQGRKPEQIVSKDTPRELTAWLRKHPPEGQVFNPQWWGDWLAWDGPKDIRVFMTTNAVHVAPRTVWRDYLTIAQCRDNWMSLLSRYNVQTVVVHKNLQTGLWLNMRRQPDWHLAYDDRIAAVFKKGPKPPEPKAPASAGREPPVSPAAQ